MELGKNEMKQINGGVAWETVAAIGAFIIYVIGTLSGYTNPTKCNN